MSCMTRGGKGLGEWQMGLLGDIKGTQISLTFLQTPSKYIKNFYKLIIERQKNSK